MINAHDIVRLSAEIHANNVAAGWWSDPRTGERIDRNVGEILMLITSELCEAGEEIVDTGCWRSNGLFMDDKLPHRLMLEVELADTAIRVFDLAGGLSLDLAGPWACIDADDTDIVEARPSELGTNLFRLVAEVAKAMEGHRKNKRDANWPEYLAIEVHLARLLYGIWQLAEVHGLDVDTAMAEKRAYNASREDHKIENRIKDGGKAY